MSFLGDLYHLSRTRQAAIDGACRYGFLQPRLFHLFVTLTGEQVKMTLASIYK
jgi:hypothetical protein